MAPYGRISNNLGALPFDTATLSFLKLHMRHVEPGDMKENINDMTCDDIRYYF